MKFLEQVKFRTSELPSTLVLKHHILNHRHQFFFLFYSYCVLLFEYHLKMSNNISVDGNALSTSQRTATVITDPNILYEINELQRKLDRREMELKRKDKDVIMLQKEIARYQKDMKGATSEVQSIRERNEQLQQSLMNSRLLSQDARDDAEARIKNARIKELEHGISAALHKYNVIQGELDANAMEKRALENENTSLLARIELLESDLEANKKESYTQGLKLKTYEMRYKDRSEEFEELKKHTLEERKEFKNSDLTITKLKKTLEEKNEQISMLEREVKSLKDTLGVRNESNAILREEMEDIHTKKHVLDKKDMKRFQQIEIENTTLTNRLKSMTKSVDLHMELLRRAENDNVKLKKALEEASNVNAKLNRDYEKFTKEKGIDAVTLANMRKDVMVLRKENKEYAERLKCALENQSTNQNAEQEVLNIKQGMEKRHLCIINDYISVNNLFYFLLY